MNSHVGVVRCAPFQSRTVGCAQMWLKVLEKASRDMPLLEESGWQAHRDTVRQCCVVVRMAESRRDL